MLGESRSPSRLSSRVSRAGGSWREAAFACQPLQLCLSGGGPHPARAIGAPAGPTEARPSLQPSPPLGPREREGAARGPGRWRGWAWAWAPGNVLAQNYIRLEVSIFCSILLPDLIVHLWQCLYTSPFRTTRLPQQPGAPTL